MIDDNPMPTHETKWPPISELVEQFRGCRFGELVLQHAQQPAKTVIKSFVGTSQLLPTQFSKLSEGWLDFNGQGAHDHSFWQRDCGDTLEEIVRRGRQFAQTNNLRVDDDTLLNLFQLALINFAYGCQKEPNMKRFIQDALDWGWFRRNIVRR